MKKFIIFYFLSFAVATLLPTLSFSQSVAINADSSKADASAILDLKSTKKGLLIPRMTMVQRDSIASPALGLLIYQTDNTAGYYYYDGSAWTPLKSSDGGGGTNNFWSLNDGDDIHNTNDGNVGIGTPFPKSKLYVRTNLNTTGFTHYGLTDSISSDSIIVKEAIGGVSASIGTKTNHPFRFISNDTGRMSILADGNITMGDNNTPELGKLTISTQLLGKGFVQTGEGGRTLATITTAYGAGIGTFSNHDLEIYANDGLGLHINASNQYVGIGTRNALNKLQIGGFGLYSFFDADFAIGDGNQAMAINVTDDATAISATHDLTINAINDIKLTSHVGIVTGIPVVNKLQIGTPAAFSGNDIAFGNGTNGTGITQGNIMTVASTTDIALLPQYGSTGKVGINTTAAKAPLDVEGFVNILSPETNFRFAYYGLDKSGFGSDADYGGTSGTADVSIFASHNVMALQFDAFSDARIKNIIGVSNAAKDLQTINALQITDYTFKDKIKYGSRLSKKVIAQQVESVYPQVVSSHVDFVPNVYQLTSKIEKTATGYLLSFAGNHNIGKDAKKLQVIMEDSSGKKEFEIVSVPSANQVIINATDLQADKLFVYGEEVNDFRTVDYEGLTTLNISATQELSKQVTKLQETIAEQSRQIEALLHEVNMQKQPVVTKR